MYSDRRLVLQSLIATLSFSITGCGGGSGGSSVAANPKPSPTPVPAPIAVWPQDYVANTSGRTIYVSNTGKDTGSGSANTPLLTLGKAVDLVNPGDTIVLADGTYDESVVLTRSGKAGSYITIKAATPGQAKLLGPNGSYSALSIRNAAWIRVEGLDIQAADGHGIETYASHHVQIVGNSCHNCGGSGISLEAGDYYLVEANSVHHNARTNRFQTSGISIYQARAVDLAAGFHIYVLRNHIFSNIESDTGLAQTTEGNGIILDDFHNSQSSTGNLAAGNYAASTLVENNLIAFNGGGGIVAYETDNATIRHNTVAFNNTDRLNIGTLRGELANSQGRNNRWYNNIAVANSQTSRFSVACLDLVTGGFENTGTQWAGNLFYDTAAPLRDSVQISGSSNQQSLAQALANNLFQKDPSFVNGFTLGSPDSFKLSSNSPAVNTGLLAFASRVDYNGKVRAEKPDVGALEL
jgi:hypothetical protein